MFYKEIDFKEQKPLDTGKTYFFYTIYNYSWIDGYYSGSIRDMEEKFKDDESHSLTWLQPEEEYDPKAYFERIKNYA